jgi:hypothetical protein
MRKARKLEKEIDEIFKNTSKPTDEEIRILGKKIAEYRKLIERETKIMNSITLSIAMCIGAVTIIHVIRGDYWLAFYTGLIFTVDITIIQMTMEERKKFKAKQKELSEKGQD